MKYRTLLALALITFGVVVSISAYLIIYIGQAGIWTVLNRISEL